MNTNVLMVNGDTDEWRGVYMAVDTDGALLLTNGPLVPGATGLPADLLAMYASGMWVRVEVVD